MSGTQVTAKPRSSFPSRGATEALLAGIVVALVIAAAFALWRASRAGIDGRNNLALAESDLLAQRIEPARQDLRFASQDFHRLHDQLHGLPFGPAIALLRFVPFVRVQLRAVDVFGETGTSLSQAGLLMTDAASTVGRPSGSAVPLSESLDKLRIAQSSFQRGVGVLDTATSRLNRLNNFRLLGPIDHARRDALRRVTRIDATARSADQALDAIIAFTGGNGPRQYLVLSQNPDEVRPTGGFLGSYGVLTANGGHVRLDRYDDSITWVEAHPEAVVLSDQIQAPFRFYDPPLPQTLANVNAIPDWPSVAQLALSLWQRGGETPADGVVSFTPEFLARVLAVTGAVSIPSFNETVTAANVVAKLDFYTHKVTAQRGTDRKQAFLSPLGQAVMVKLLDAPTSQWRGLSAALGKAFAARELQVWSRDAAVQSTLAARGWEGLLPARDGDFFYDGEFEYGAKNGRGLKRTFDHKVMIHADGSAQVTTTITINNTEDPGPNNNNVQTYYRIYGPTGAVVDTVASDPPLSDEPAISGHPATGWLLPVAARSVGTIKVVWNVNGLAQQLTNGSWQFSLMWMHIVDNTGDTLNLTVQLPSGAHWVGTAPPRKAALNQDISGRWSYRLAG